MFVHLLYVYSGRAWLYRSYRHPIGIRALHLSRAHHSLSTPRFVQGKSRSLPPAPSRLLDLYLIRDCHQKILDLCFRGLVRGRCLQSAG